MKIPGKSFRVIDYLDESPWVKKLAQASFYRDHPEFQKSHDDDHKGLAFFTMMQNGMPLTGEFKTFSGADFDSIPAPKEFVKSVEPLLIENFVRHQDEFGPSAVNMAKVGLYCFLPGGICGYHTDGPVYLKGQRMDINDPQVQRAIAWTQCTHRTILPIQVNSEDEFWICGTRKRITNGLWFEFDNSLPHAFFNKGSHPTVLLVSTIAKMDEKYKDLKWNS